MMEWSTPAMCWLWRQLSQHSRLYTEMVVTGALIHGDPERHLQRYPGTGPLALQLGGSDAHDLAQCARLGQRYGFDEINLNVGCPSDRVQNGMIGAILMKHPQKVTDALKAMIDSVDIPVTIKHRLGVDELDSYDFVRDFVGQVQESGCRVFIVHARKALLQGLSPKENRDIPPLRYDWVYQLKRDFPQLCIVLNGGIQDLSLAEQALEQVDGVMLGRAAYQNPMLLSQVDAQLFADQRPPMSAEQLIHAYCHFIDQQPGHVKHYAKHLMGFFQGVPGGRLFRRHLSENIHKDDATSQCILDALACVLKLKPRV